MTDLQIADWKEKVARKARWTKVQDNAAILLYVYRIGGLTYAAAKGLELFALMGI